uniref:ZT_dimer domain-containing protein n=1 Tax=Ascaris lumbricoides TaxID=6252 RepID=A0A0M3IQV4_ASCLU
MLKTPKMVALNLCGSLRELRRKNGIKEFYRYQRNLQELLKEDEELLRRGQNDQLQENAYEDRRKLKWDTWLARITLFLNIGMIIAKTMAAYLSNSLSIISSVVDSVMDITSGTVIWICLRSIRKTNRYDYPIGRNRLEHLAVMFVAIVMIIANFIVIGDAAISTITKNIHPIVDLPTIIIMVAGTVLKAILFLVCRRQKSPGSMVLAIDQRNDVLTNIVALAGAYIGNHFWLYADPLGAFFVCCFIIISWARTAYEQIPFLIGKAASREFINRILKIAITHDENIRFIDTIIVYHLGANFLVELHVVMDPEMKLRQTHDTSETLQIKLERLPYVERAFVHCDYQLDGDEHI